jgi:hypothetical protein
VICPDNNRIDTTSCHPAFFGDGRILLVEKIMKSSMTEVDRQDSKVTQGNDDPKCETSYMTIEEKLICVSAFLPVDEFSLRNGLEDR